MQLYLAIFDAHGVLVNSEPSLEYLSKTSIKFFADNGLKFSKHDIDAAWSQASKGMEKSPEGLYAARMRLFERLHIPLELSAKYGKIDLDSLQHAEPMDPSERNVLRKIKALGLYLTVLSDTVHSSNEISSMLEAAGLGGIFESVFVPGDTGHSKPDSEAYMAVLESFKAEPENAVFVGHEKDELDGAKLLGMTTISYKVKTKSADYVAKDYKEIFGIIKAIKRGIDPKTSNY